ncbi:MAG: hypothetical protein J7M25_12260 [Deltaproteobacteria bacterium]|nr:hypothetical protein [Deltaproteobacteria bacterium]
MESSPKGLDWKDVLVTVLAFFVAIWATSSALDTVLTSWKKSKQDVRISMSKGHLRVGPPARQTSLAGKVGRSGQGGTWGKSGPKRLTGKVGRWKRLHANEIVALIQEYGSQQGRGIDRLRSMLANHRVAINVRLVSRAASRRTAWLNWVKGLFDLAALAGWLFFFGPLWLWWKLQGDLRRRETTIKAIPHFAVTGAAVMVVALTMISIVVGIVKIQMELAAFGAPKAAVADSFMQYIIYGSDEDVTVLTRLLIQARHAVQGAPWMAAGLLYSLWSALDTLRHSAVLVWARTSLSVAGWLVSLYGPAIAATTALLAWKVVWPVLHNSAQYPVRRVRGEEAAGLWSFIKEQLGILWKEVRASIWMALFIFVFVALSVVAIRALSYPVVEASIKLVVGTVELVAQGRPVPQTALVASLLSLVLYLLVASAMFLAPVGVLVTKTYRVVRVRLYEHRRYKKFGGFWRAVRLGLLNVMGITALAAGASFGAYHVLVHLIANPMVRVWLPALMFAPVLFAMLHAGSVFGTLKAVILMSIGDETEPVV